MNRLQPTTALFTTIVLITIIEAFIKPLVYMVKGFIKLMKPFNLGKELYECCLLYTSRITILKAR